jgi:CDP-diacylglycerol--glycerol-3-phosphate 3-phosphatidyltransferase
MPRLVFLALVAAAFTYAASAAPAPAPAAPAAADLYTVTDIRIDATAESAQAARDLAMAQGRPVAWQRIYRRLTPSAQWARQPRLSDQQLFRLIRSFEVSGERRSTTRYLADVTYHFNPAAVRQLLRQSGVAFTETRSRPAIVIPMVADAAFDPMSDWSVAWNHPSYNAGLVPMMLPDADVENEAILTRTDLLQADWGSLLPLSRRYNASLIVVAVASADGRSVRAIEISPAGRTPSSFAFAQPNFAALADAVTEKVAESWKGRSSVDYATRARLVADVQFNSLEEWSRIRSQLGAVRAVSDFEVLGLARNEAEIDLGYFGRTEQLRDAMAQQNLNLESCAQSRRLHASAFRCDCGHHQMNGVVRHLPNILTSLRLVAAPATAALLVLGDYAVAFAVFAAAGLSDAVDGYLAKRFGFSTRFGRILDPIADKALMFAAFIMLGVLDEAPIWLIVVMIGRDALITLGLFVGVAAQAPITVQPLILGKLCTALQVFYVATHLASLAFAFPLDLITPYDAYLLAMVALASTLDYSSIWLKAMRVAWNKRASPS